MANAYALISEAVWRDKDFRALSRNAQCTYFQLLSQRELDCAGILTLHIDYLSKGCDDVTGDDLWLDLNELEKARFIVVDSDTDELLIRSYIRRVTAPNRNRWVAAKKAVKMIESSKIRAVLAVELRRVDRPDATDLANEIEAPSKPLRTGIEAPSMPLTVGSPFEAPSKPLVQYSSSSSVTSVGGLVGEAPPKFCSKHMPDGTTDNCHACRTARQTREQFEIAAQERRAERRAAFLNEIAACPDCDNGLIEYDDTDDPLSQATVEKCPKHNWAAND